MPRKPPASVSIEVPAELASSMRAIVDHIAGFGAATRSPMPDFASAESLLASLVSKLECDGLAMILTLLDPASERVEVEGRVYRRMSLEAAESYCGLRGDVRVTRGLYRLEGMHDGPTIVPLELRAGIVEGRYTPAAARVAATLAAEMPSRAANAVCRSAGILPHARASQDRLGSELGQRWEVLRKKGEVDLVETMEIPATAVAVSVAVDRVSLPMAEPRERTPDDDAAGVERPIEVNYRMAFVGAVTLYDADGEPISAIRHAHVPEGGACAMETSFRRDLDVLLRRRPDLRIVTLADGAPEMQGILDRATAGLPIEARIVDFYHLVEHLSDAIRATGAYVSDLLGDWKSDLLERDDAVEAIEIQLRAWKNEHPAGACPPGIHGALTYIENHRERLRYATTRAAGLPIGSGTVEATGKAIVEVRMRRPGARWLATGAQAIMGLRAVATSSDERWNGAMKHLLHSYRAEVRPRRGRRKRTDS